MPANGEESRTPCQASKNLEEGVETIRDECTGQGGVYHRSKRTATNDKKILVKLD